MVNPIERLLDSLPAAVAKEKRAAIQQELESVGMWNHYSQTVKVGKDMGKMYLRAAVVFKRHLGVTDDFFVGTQEQQNQEHNRIARLHFDLFSKATPVS